MMCGFNRLSTSRLAGWHYTQGVKTLRVKPERLASISYVENDAPSRRRTWKAVQDTARLCKEREVISSEFAGALFSWLEHLPWAHDTRLQQLNPSLLTTNVSNKSGNLLFAQK